MYKLNNDESIISPQLIFYKDYIDVNLKKAIDLVGAQRLWPHIKTHKSSKMIDELVHKGISKFKCATIAECEILARSEATDIVLAYPLVGPNIERFLRLVKSFKNKNFYAIGDSLEQIKKLDHEAKTNNLTVNFLIDVNMGMNRTGINISKVYGFIDEILLLKHINLVGIHCYDGNHNNKDIAVRQQNVDDTFNLLAPSIDKLSKALNQDPLIIAGGTPAFPCYIKYNNVFCSPGTCFLHDFGYKENIPDMSFVPAACVLSRVISHPNDNIFTIDCGYKAIASDPKVLRGHIVGLSDKVEELFQSEEHWVFKMKSGFEDQIPPVGTVLYVIPTHICPTSNLYEYALVSENHEIVDKWYINARNRIINF